MSDIKSAGQRFIELFTTHSSYLSDKWEHYLQIYEIEIGSMISSGRPISLLEIGVQNGGSLEIWSKYLPQGSRIVGVDVDSACADLKFPENVQFILADASDPAILDKLPIDLFDVIIDDGSHRPVDVIKTFSMLIDRLKPGGKYIIEDMETSYDTNYGGGFRQPSSTTEWAKGFIDALNVDNVADDELNKHPDAESLRNIGRSLWNVTFYSSAMVFTKSAKKRDQRYRRVMSGQTMSVMDPKDWIADLPAAVFADISMNEICWRTVSEDLVKEVQHLRSQQSAIAKRLAELQELASDGARRDPREDTWAASDQGASALVVTVRSGAQEPAVVSHGRDHDANE